MSPLEGRSARAGRRRRRTVRIVQPRSSYRPATISFLVVGSAAIILLLVWRFWQGEAIEPAYQRRLSEIRLDWRCDAGHEFRAAGQVGTHPCTKCEAPAYPVDTYECKVHGPRKVAVKLKLHADGLPHPSEFRVVGERWEPAEGGAHCPRCGRMLSRVRKDPFTATMKGRKKSGG